ncbi:unnamed protein product [Closterium sp. NIES-65]|nr:unnamed protein product [Closterium sp. NIES-65]
MPDRYWVIFSTSLAFVLCNMDKVNLSIAIIPMAHDFGWSATTVGVVQSSFYWGYALSLLPAGWLCQKFTGTRMLRAGVLIWSIATAAIPSAAAFLPSLLFSRVAVSPRTPTFDGFSPSSSPTLLQVLLITLLLPLTSPLAPSHSPSPSRF